MKILQLIFSLSSGGAEKVVVNLSNELVSEKNDVLICLILKKSKRNTFYMDQLNNKIKVIYLNSNNGVNMLAFFKVYKAIKEYNPDIVHMHLNTLIYGFFPSLLFKKIKFFHTIHNLAQKEVGLRFQKKLNSFFYKNQITPIAISKKCEESFVQLYNSKKIYTIENGVKKYEKSRSFESAVNEITKLKNNKNSLIYTHVGRFSKQKNQKLLIKTFNDLYDDGFNVILLMIGSGFDSNTALKLKSISKKNIHFLGEKVNVGDYLYLSDCFVLSSLWEGMPMTLLEAMSCGTPSVATPAGGCIDIISSKGVGILSKNFSKESYKKAIIESIKMIISSSFKKKDIQKEFQKKFSIESCSKKYLDVYKIKDYENTN